MSDSYYPQHAAPAHDLTRERDELRRLLKLAHDNLVLHSQEYHHVTPTGLMTRIKDAINGSEHFHALLQNQK